LATLDKKVAVEGIRDRQLLDRFAALPAHRKRALVEALDDVRNQRLMHALLRDPLLARDPSHEATWAK